ncbi:MobA/MobL family protein [Polymorphobacter sp.]|uniref:MobA/MobL family protein n=1 Tax=Polymorphobacter sp. TaxID=1909290 RepID=UPI003F6F1005
MSDDELIEFEMHPEARGDFKIRPISREWRYLGRKPAYRTAVCNVAYISRDSSAIDVFGKMPRSFSQRGYELRGCGLMLPGSAPQWAREGYRIWEEADANTAATCDPRDASAWHVCGQIPGSLPADLWSWFVTIFVERELTNKGAAVAWAIHGLQGDDGEWIVRPHFHLIVSRLYWRHRAKKFGTRHPAWLANRKAQARLAGAWHRWCGTSHLWRRLKGEHAKRWTGE